MNEKMKYVWTGDISRARTYIHDVYYLGLSTLGEKIILHPDNNDLVSIHVLISKP